MDKRILSERDICTKFITPALRRAGWDEMVLKVTPFTAMGRVVQLIDAFGGNEGFKNAVREMQNSFYENAA